MRVAVTFRDSAYVEMEGELKTKIPSQITVSVYDHDGGSADAALIEQALGLLEKIRKSAYPDKIKVTFGYPEYVYRPIGPADRDPRKV